MRRIVLIIMLLLPGMVAMAQNDYNASLIPKDLLPYASAVIRDKEVNIEVKDLENTVYHIKQAITVLNKNGDRDAHIIVEHDKNNLIKYIKGVVYNEFGKPVKKFSESDFEDVSAYDGFSLFQDTRLKHYLPSVTDYPYTITYEYEERSKQSLAFDDWEPNPYIGVAVEKSTFVFTCKPDFNIHYKEINIPGKATIGTNVQGLKTYTWQVNNLKAVKDEPFSEAPERTLSSIKIAPEKFTYYGIGGVYTNWKELGKWEYDKLLANRQELPTETVEYIKGITRDITDPKLKAKKIYEYMQGRTHYVSVQVGIGGYQPFPASDVDKLNYGDCKALVNYTQALLKAVNIDSYYCVVKSGREYKISLQDDFASLNQGDHIILCLPFKNDTTWADCTSQTIPFGYLGSFTDDRTVLACTPQGGKLLHTPKYTTEENLQKRKASFVINESGGLKGDIETQFKGIEYENRDWLIRESPVERIKDIKGVYPINNLEIEKLTYKQDKSFKPVTTENIELSANDYGSVNDGKLYFMLNSVNHIKSIREVRNRINPVEITRGYTEEDEIIYTIPKGYRLESEPLKMSSHKPFGSFTATMTINGDQLTYNRKFQIKDGTYDKDTYQDIVDLYQLAADADGYNVALVKN